MSDSPTAPRERETPMSALDQQVQDARNNLSDFVDGLVDPETTDEEHTRLILLVDALLTTHRRQVLQEVEAKLNAEAATMSMYTVVPQKDTWRDAADFVASLRDTKETP